MVVFTSEKGRVSYRVNMGEFGRQNSGVEGGNTVPGKRKASVGLCGDRAGSGISTWLRIAS